MVEWTMGPTGPRVVHPAPCACGCWCGKGCRCNGQSCKCELCDIYEDVGWDYQSIQKERLLLCDCSLCKKAKPDAANRFRDRGDTK